jgi:hypothetical protein
LLEGLFKSSERRRRCPEIGNCGGQGDDYGHDYKNLCRRQLPT